MVNFILKYFFIKKTKRSNLKTIIKQNREITRQTKRNTLLKKEKDISYYFINAKSLLKSNNFSVRSQREDLQFQGRNLWRGNF